DGTDGEPPLFGRLSEEAAGAVVGAAGGDDDAADRDGAEDGGDGGHARGEGEGPAALEPSEDLLEGRPRRAVVPAVDGVAAEAVGGRQADRRVDGRARSVGPAEADGQGRRVQRHRPTGAATDGRHTTDEAAASAEAQDARQRATQHAPAATPPT